MIAQNSVFTVVVLLHHYKLAGFVIEPVIILPIEIYTADRRVLTKGVQTISVVLLGERVGGEPAAGAGGVETCAEVAVRDALVEGASAPCRSVRDCCRATETPAGTQWKRP